MSDNGQHLIEIEKVRDLLVTLRESLDAKRPKIHTYESWHEQTFLAFDSYNLGITNALDLLGDTQNAIERLIRDANGASK